MATSVLSLAALISTANLADGQQVKSDEHNTGRRNWEQRMNKLLGAATDMQENYAGASEPNERRDGSIWYDETNTVFQARKSSAWVEMMDLTDGYSQSLSTAGTETFKPGGAIDVNTTQVSRAGAGDLQTYAMPGSSLSNDGSVVISTVFVTAPGGLATGVIELSFGATIGSRPTAEDETDAFGKMFVVRTGAATQKIAGFCVGNNDATGRSTRVINTTATEALSGAVTIKTSTDGGGVGSDTSEIMITKLLP